MRRINVAQVGTWRHTHGGHVMMSMRSMPHIYNVVGICEPDPALKEAAMPKEIYRGLKWLTLEQVLQDTSLDAVIVETKELEQGKYALMFAERGFHIHLEKPGAASAEEFRQLVTLVKKNNTVLQTGYMYRYNPAVMRAIEHVRSGKIGDVLRMEAQMSLRYNRQMLNMVEELPGGMMYYLGCHLVDLLYTVMGAPERVIPLNRCSGIEGTNALDAGLALYEYPRGVSILRTVACEIDGGSRRGMVITGTKGTIIIPTFESPITAPPITNANTTAITTKYYSDAQPTVLATEEMSFEPYGRYDDMMLDFARIVCGDIENPYSPDHELAVFQLTMDSL